MAINKNFVVKNGLEVNTNQIFADSATGKVGIGSTLPTVELDVQGAIAATDVVSSLLRVTGYSTLPQVTVNENISISGFTTTNQGMNVLGISSLSNLRVVGVTTFENNVNLDGNVNVTGFSTFVGLTSVVGNLKVSGFTTFSNLVDINDNVDILGVTTVSSLGSPSEILVVGTGKSLASLSNITADASGINISGVVTASTGGFDGDLTGDVTGNADTATALETARDFSISGDATASAISFDGTANVGLALTLADTAVSAGSYGSSTEIPSFTVDSKGRLTAAGTASVGTALTVAGDSGSEVIDLLTESLTIAGGTNLTSSAASDTVTVNLDSDISLDSVTATGIITATGGFDGSFTGDISGNADTATALETARSFEITGDVVASAISFDGTGNVSFAATVVDDSHNHVISNVDGLQTALNAKAPLASPALTGTPTAPTAASGTNTTQVATTAFVASAIAGEMSGNAATATALETARTIGGVSFDGTANINLPGVNTAGNQDTSGNAATSTTSTNANNINVADESSDTTCFPVFATDATGNQAPKTDSSALTYNASTGTLAATNVNSTSDANLKENVENIVGSIDILKDINGVKFVWKKLGTPSVGVIAQDVEKVLPELVSERSDTGTKSVNYNGLVGVLIEAVKELSARVSELENR